jgi:hypothetical protein
MVITLSVLKDVLLGVLFASTTASLLMRRSGTIKLWEVPPLLSAALLSFAASGEWEYERFGKRARRRGSLDPDLPDETLRHDEFEESLRGSMTVLLCQCGETFPSIGGFSLGGVGTAIAG